ncbi:MAG: transporter substrate-binding domain-containing protein [Burkholderiales bacterium]|nr:transporter substrate-binding domain-containing protein [Burkholderiales bacterium]
MSPSRALSLVVVALFASLSFLAQEARAQSAAPAKAPAGAEDARALDIDAARRAWKGDFDGIKARRYVRVLVPYSRTLFFNDRGTQRGITADTLRDFEQWLNRKHKTGSRPITVVAIPTTRDRLVPLLIEGRGDIAAGNLTITPERQKQVDFSAPVGRNVAEVVVTGAGAPALARVGDLAGKQIHVRKASSYHESLAALNERFAEERKPRIKLTLVPDALEDEDMMEMANAGLLAIIVVDDWKAKMWAQVLPRIKVHGDIAVRTGGDIAWALRKGSPLLAAEVNDFVATSIKAGRLTEQRLATYMRRVKQIGNNTEAAEWKRFEATIAYFRKYGDRYGFDPLMLAAQGYQESRLDQNAKSPVGAIGIMQIMPATGAELGVGDITKAEPNVHGGVKYMDQLHERYFKGVPLDKQNLTLFAFAAYNAGPGRVQQLRREAEKEGLDPNVWFNNVELIAAKRVGQETVGYVRNIYKYYVAYSLQLELLEARRQAAEKVKAGAGR